MLSVTLGIHIKQKQVSWPAPLAAANTSRLPRSAMEEPMRNTRTAAGFEPMPSKMQSNKMLPVTFGIHWNPKTRMQAHRRQKLWISSRIQEKRMPKNSFTSPSEPIKNNKKQCFGTVPKHPNWSGSETPEH